MSIIFLMCWVSSQLQSTVYKVSRIGQQVLLKSLFNLSKCHLLLSVYLFYWYFRCKSPMVIMYLEFYKIIIESPFKLFSLKSLLFLPPRGKRNNLVVARKTAVFYLLVRCENLPFLCTFLVIVKALFIFEKN